MHSEELSGRELAARCAFLVQLLDEWLLVPAGIMDDSQYLQYKELQKKTREACRG